MSQVVSGVVRDGVVVPESPLPEGQQVEFVAPGGVPVGAGDEGAIHDRGRGPEIKGTRITVYDVLDYLLDAWHPHQIAAFLRISSPQVEAAIEYVREHKLEVLREYLKMLEREKQGNPPELQARLDAGRERFQALVARVRAIEETDPAVRQVRVEEMIRAHREAARQGGGDAGPHGR
jgi:uncharacterized protein (DUF433 family)